MRHRSLEASAVLIILMMLVVIVIPIISHDAAAQELDEMEVGDPASIPPLTLDPIDPCPDIDVDIFERRVAAQRQA